VAEMVAGKDRGAENTGPRDLSYQMRMKARDYRFPAEPVFSMKEALHAARTTEYI
jgi:hypothetical protein